MWFERKRRDVEEAPQHWPTERMVNEGYPEYATETDLEGLSGEELFKIAAICNVVELAPPGECLPCLAMAKAMDMAPPPEVEAGEASEVEEYAPPRLVEDPDHDPAYVDSQTHNEPVEEEERDLSEIFADKVAELGVLVEEMLHGPPIPPKNVTMVDLSLLMLAADKWVQMSEIQGGLAPQQQQMLDATKALVSRLRS
jgi:hypothetical protein